MESRREWKLHATGSSVNLSQLKTNLKIVAEVLFRLEPTALGIGPTQGDPLSKEEVAALSFFGISTSLGQFRRDPELALRSQQAQIQEWLIDRIWPRPSDPEYAETLSAFRRHITTDLRDVPWNIEAWPEIMNESGVIIPIFSERIRNLRSLPLPLPLPMPISPANPEDSHRGSTPSSKKTNRKALSESQIREILRHRLLLSCTRNATAEALDISKGSVTHYATVAARAGLTWEKVASFTGAELLAVMRPDLEKRRKHVEPDFNHAHYWLQRGSTLRQLWKEYQTKHAGLRTYGYSRFCELYDLWLPDGRLVKTPSRKQVNRPGRA